MNTTGIILLSILSLIILIIFYIIIRGTDKSKQWLNNQFEWFKGFFEENNGQPNKPSHKNLLSLAVVSLFIIAYVRVLVATSSLQLIDIPNNWQQLLLGILLIRSIQSIFEKRSSINTNNNITPNNINNFIDTNTNTNTNTTSNNVNNTTNNNI
jgi:hypothetical protein